LRGRRKKKYTPTTADFGMGGLLMHTDLYLCKILRFIMQRKRIAEYRIDINLIILSLKH